MGMCLRSAETMLTGPHACRGWVGVGGGREGGVVRRSTQDVHALTLVVGNNVKSNFGVRMMSD